MQGKLLAKACAAGLLAASFPALATFHLIKVVEVFPGTPAAPSAQYVVIQMYASGENLVGGHALTVFNAAGTQVGSFTFPGNLPNGANQTKILIATSQAESFFGVTADLVMSASVLSAGGKVCWAGTLDCVAWGAYSGSSTGVGTPFNASSGITPGRAAARRLNIAGSASLLDAGDDTDNSANDFAFATPAPRNNAGVLGRIPPSTCGNGALEGLEQCDDHNLANGDGCSSTCAVEASTGNRHPIGDYDGDGRSDVLWRNPATGSNSVWRSGNGATPMAVRLVSGQSWNIVGRGDFNGDDRTDILWRNSSTGANAIWFSANAATAQTLATVASQSWQVLGVGDFDGDGRSDILWRNSTTGSNSIWKAGNAATPQALSPVSNPSWRIVGTGDFDNDGKSDILWRNVSTGANSIWRSGNLATQMVLFGVTNQSWKIVAIGDFDGDGKSDLFWRNTSTGANSIWKAANAATQIILMGVTNQSWQIATTGDFNGDGKDDVFWRNASTGANSIWNSGNSATPQSAIGVTNLSWTIVPREGQISAAATTSSSAPTLAISNASVTEGNAGTRVATFTISLSRAAASAVTYNIATANGSASAGEDYTASSLSGQSIPAGATSKTFGVSVMGDPTYEADETFSVNVGSVSGATVADGSGSGVIVNDDPYYGY